jgi:hypothetical protein
MEILDHLVFPPLLDTYFFLVTFRFSWCTVVLVTSTTTGNLVIEFHDDGTSSAVDISGIDRFPRTNHTQKVSRTSGNGQNGTWKIGQIKQGFYHERSLPTTVHCDPRASVASKLLPFPNLNTITCVGTHGLG